MVEINQSTARRVMLKLFTAGTATAATGKTVAVTLSKNGGAFANPSGGATNATELANGWYYVDLTTTDTNTLGDLVVRGTATGCDDSERLFAVAPAPNRGMTGIPNAVIAGTVGASASATSIPTSSLSPSSSVADQFKGRTLIFDNDTATAALRGQATDITANTNLGVLTVTALTTAPASGDTFKIV